MLVRVEFFLFHVNFTIMDFCVDEDTFILLGRPFLATRRTLVDVEKGEITMRADGQQKVFNNSLKYLEEEVVNCFLISSWDSLINKQFIRDNDELEKYLDKLEKEELKKEHIVSEPF